MHILLIQKTTKAIKTVIRQRARGFPVSPTWIANKQASLYSYYWNKNYKKKPQSSIRGQGGSLCSHGANKRTSSYSAHCTYNWYKKLQKQLKQLSARYPWRKICHVETFQISKHNKSGEVWNFSTSAMWIRLRFLHMTDVKNFWNYSTLHSLITKQKTASEMHVAPRIL